MFTDYAIVEEICSSTAKNENFHCILGSNGRALLINGVGGGWVTGNRDLFQKFKKHGAEDLLRLVPVVATELVEKRRNLIPFKSVNPWIIKVTDRCNLACTYCYADGGTKGGEMSRDTARKVVDEMLALRQRSYSVIFHGGEPTLNMPAVREVVAQLDSRKADGVEVRYHMQSNLFSFPDSLQEELRALHIEIGTSLDGDLALNDKQRQCSNNVSVYRRVVSNLAKLARRSVIVTVTSDNQGELLRIAKHLIEDLGVDDFHFLPLLPHGRGAEKERLPSVDVMTGEVLKVVDYVLDLFLNKRKINFRNLHGIVSALIGPDYHVACQNCSQGGGQGISIRFDGTFGPCDITATYPEYALGNVHEVHGNIINFLNSSKNFRVFKRLETMDGCCSCALRTICAGGCEEESVRPGYERSLYCNYYYILYNSVAAHFKELKQSGYLAHLLAGRDLTTATYRFKENLVANDIF